MGTDTRFSLWDFSSFKNLNIRSLQEGKEERGNSGWTRGLEEGKEREQGRSRAAVFLKTVQQADRKAYAMMPHRTLLFWGEPTLVTAVISQWLIRPPGSLALGHRAGTTPQLHSMHGVLRRDFYASMVLPNSQDSNEKCILFYFSKIFQMSILCSAFYTPSSQCPPQRPGSLLSFRMSLYIGIQVQASFLSVSPLSTHLRVVSNPSRHHLLKNPFTSPFPSSSLKVRVDSSLCLLLIWEVSLRNLPRICSHRR